MGRTYTIFRFVSLKLYSKQPVRCCVWHLFSPASFNTNASVYGVSIKTNSILEDFAF